MQSKFSLVDGKFLFHDENLVAVALDSRYARPLLLKMEDLELEDGTEAALKILCHISLSGSLVGKVRLPTAADHEVAKAIIRGPQTKYGHKHTCYRCSQKFFDLNGKIGKCPSCNTPISPNT